MIYLRIASHLKPHAAPFCLYIDERRFIIYFNTQFKRNCRQYTRLHQEMYTPLASSMLPHSYFTVPVQVRAASLTYCTGEEPMTIFVRS